MLLYHYIHGLQNYGNRKQLARKWSGKEMFEVVPKNSQRWSWGDVGRQTVLEAASSHRKRTIADSNFTKSTESCLLSVTLERFLDRLAEWQFSWGRFINSKLAATCRSARSCWFTLPHLFIGAAPAHLACSRQLYARPIPRTGRPSHVWPGPVRCDQ